MADQPAIETIQPPRLRRGLRLFLFYSPAILLTGLVSMLFADLRSFTALCDRLDPAVTVDILNGYFKGMCEVVRRHHGHVNQLIGDGMLALFGAFESNPWQARDAVLAALDMRAELARYNATRCVSGLRHDKSAIASHIVPWSEDHQNRLNPRNGLCLSALHDRAYDQGLITVLPDFTIRVSTELRSTEGDDFARRAIAAFDGRSIQLPERFKPDEAFLTSHAQRFGYL